MNTKLTLRMDKNIIHQAKAHAARRGKSVSQMFGEYVSSLESTKNKPKLPPTTKSLLGVLKGTEVSETDYKKHLEEKHA